MANKKISAMTPATVMETGDSIPFLDVSLSANDKITIDNLALYLESIMQGLSIAVAGGTVDAITATYTPAIALTNMKICAFVAAGANTVINPTFAPNGLTAHTITKNGGSALAAGDIPGALAICLLQYNVANTRWELLNPAGTSFTRSLLNCADATAVLTALGLTITAFAKTFLDDADAATVKATLGISAGATGARVNKTDGDSPYSVSAANLSGLSVFTNTGAGAQCIFQLPAGADGYMFQGMVTVAQYMQFKANGSEKIRYLGVESAAGGYVRSNVIGNFIMGIWSGTEWVIKGIGGAWTYDS